MLRVCGFDASEQKYAVGSILIKAGVDLLCLSDPKFETLSVVLSKGTSKFVFPSAIGGHPHHIGSMGVATPQASSMAWAASSVMSSR